MYIFLLKIFMLKIFCIFRAVYRDADIYIFDDPLSAVDPSVCNDLFKDCINGFLKDKTRVFVTHQLQCLKEADMIFLLNNVSSPFKQTNY